MAVTDKATKEIILKRWEDGEKVDDLATEYNVSKFTIRSWKTSRSKIESIPQPKTSTHKLKEAFQEELENIDKRKQEIEYAYQNELPKLDTRKKLLDELLKTY